MGAARRVAPTPAYLPTKRPSLAAPLAAPLAWRRHNKLRTKLAGRKGELERLRKQVGYWRAGELAGVAAAEQPPAGWVSQPGLR